MNDFFYLHGAGVANLGGLLVFLFLEKYWKNMD
jgi:hypothetical protein